MVARQTAEPVGIGGRLADRRKEPGDLAKSSDFFSKTLEFPGGMCYNFSRGNAPVAQLDRAQASDAWCRRFESCSVRQNEGTAQRRFPRFAYRMVMRTCPKNAGGESDIRVLHAFFPPSLCEGLVQNPVRRTKPAGSFCCPRALCICISGTLPRNGSASLLDVPPGIDGSPVPGAEALM